MPDDNGYIELRVIEALKPDVGHGKARMPKKFRKKLGLNPGDIVELKGRRVTAAVVWRARPEDEERDSIRIDRTVRNNAKVNIGDKIEVRKAKVKNAVSVTLAPMVKENHRVQFGSGIENFIKRGLLKHPLHKGDTVIVPGIALMGGYLPFSVVSTSPKGIIEVGLDTNISLREEPAGEVEVSDQISYEDIGGLGEELQRVREMIELPLKHPELFDRLGISPPKGVLLHGPPGTGKTLIAKAVANESGANFYSIQGPEIMNKFYGQSEENLRNKFDEAEKNTPSIIFIDEIDSIAPKRGEIHGEVERRVVAQMLTLMDGLQDRGKLIVIAATNRVDAIDPALRRPGRFDREIEIGVPDRKGRYEILQVHTRGMPMDEDVDIAEMAELTHGFVGADLASLVREAAMRALRRYLPEIDLDKPIPTEVLEHMHVTQEDMAHAFREVEPSAMREVLVEVPKVHWDDIGGLDEVKQELIEAVEWPLKHPGAFKRMGIRPPKGILLFGPPGTGKTMIARAVATESNANFITVKGPEIFSKWVGVSEKAVREIFKKARQVAPCIVFLDEIDSIAALRGDGAESQVAYKVVSQILTSMDGLEAMEGVVVIGATNRPDIIDTAIMRSGRFDRFFLITAPDDVARKEILKIHTRDMPIKGVDLDMLVKQTNHFSGADIESLCREAAMLALREKIDAAAVTTSHFKMAKKKVRPTCGPDVVQAYQNYYKEMLGVKKGLSTDPSTA